LSHRTRLRGSSVRGGGLLSGGLMSVSRMALLYCSCCIEGTTPCLNKVEHFYLYNNFDEWRPFYRAPGFAGIRYCCTISLRPSVRPSHCGIVSKRRHMSSNFFHNLAGHHSGFVSPTAVTVLATALDTRRKKNLQLSTEIDVYFGNGTRQAQCSYRYSGTRSTRVSSDDFE